MYQKYRVPPDFDICLDHQRAHRIGEVDGLQKCICCQEKTNVAPLSLFSELGKLYYLGAGTYCQFSFLFTMILLMAVMFLVVGLYNFILNYGAVG